VKIAHLSVRLAGEREPDLMLETDEPPRAGLTKLAGRIWPAGRTLPTPVVGHRQLRRLIEFDDVADSVEVNSSVDIFEERSADLVCIHVFWVSQQN